MMFRTKIERAAKTLTRKRRRSQAMNLLGDAQRDDEKIKIIVDQMRACRDGQAPGMAALRLEQRLNMAGFEIVDRVNE